ncbi:hypothetical protein LSH36_737g03019 [Paralvinella palmiformis]|uniref:t-SNARE coiled-coil homology domain-containing protein n=1 Tax=Paralvinella palmiformis TaxID=53620 RepID=A0AAD9J212_9ANNE|nr:hypothetical protein LSH36_737g03019 [Paralvinella palmiformis]
MSQGDFGYGSAARPDHDGPVREEFRTNPFAGEYGNFNELVDIISSNIFTINNNGSILERALKQIGTSQDCVQLRNKIHMTEQKTNHMISETVQSLRRLAKSCSSSNRQQKVQHGRLSSEFQDTVKRYNTLQKDDGGDEERLLHHEQKRAQMLAQEEAIEVEVALLEEREQHVRQLESDILDINEIFRDLGTLVHEQGAVVDTIESNIERASGNRKARKKMFCLVAILLVVLAVIALIIALSLKH